MLQRLNANTLLIGANSGQGVRENVSKAEKNWKKFQGGSFPR